MIFFGSINIEFFTRKYDLTRRCKNKLVLEDNMKNFKALVLVVFITSTINYNTNAASIPSFGTIFSVKNNIPPRGQWVTNYGYCGEVAMISAGLYYGQYLSQYDARAIASPGIKQNKSNSQLLLGVNDEASAKRMRLKYDSKSTSSNADFYTWVKNHVSKNHPVIIGVFNNEFLLYGDININAGDDEYDHIVPVIGIGSNYSLTDSFYLDDLILFSDNGLYSPNGIMPYYYLYNATIFLKDRQMANSKKSQIYSLPDYPENKYGIAIMGVMDPNNEALPVRVETSINTELPEIKNNSFTRPVSRSLKLTITVTKLTPGINYNLYRYSNENDIPTVSFNANSKNKGISPWRVINITSGSTWTTSVAIKSSDKVFFRAVKS